ncbi:hypothetical protein OG834_44030 [Streptomyces mirabilis]|uniref:hypothetical protein n=1 Tax=Streptomyces sp. WAC00263 TaxID=1917422 RepID=UPI001F50B533|nr:MULTISPECIES: hypothetical protein [Streptomyces]MCX4437775.1 hypothetical protein [Streptomyces mirabilis]
MRTDQTKAPVVRGSGIASNREDRDARSVDEGDLPEVDQHIRPSAHGQWRQQGTEHRRRQQINLAVQCGKDAESMTLGIEQ